MDYNVLGPMVVRDGIGVKALGGLKQRAVLAVLLVEAGSVVEFDRLIDLVWDRRPPAKALASLRAYVANLRRVLGADDGARLVTTSWGYRLDLGGDRLDLREFEMLAARGRDAFGRGRFAEADGQFGRALALWRGPAFVEFGDLGFAVDERVHLDEVRAVVLESAFEARLHLGRHETVIAEIERALRVSPLREHLWGQLMIALDRSHRTAEAVVAFRRAETILRAELGVAPSRYLLDIEASLYTGGSVNRAVSLVAM
ncbi:AfsR/SARP family transcriptional regulator [Rhodococcus sp. IEGM1428]|uniref:AfsR/SARP family transcriptional regulator n=1 Tax=Rhodococcus sp. IEGM1428 TaxID=3392191 RepID=UPI003D0BCA54